MTSTRTRFGAYLLTDCIGQGGMAVVYRAKRHEALPHPLAQWLH